MKKAVILLAVLGLISCTEAKKTSASASSTVDASTSDADMIKQGYTAGVIHIAKDDSKCAYTIETKELEYLLDPINLKEDYVKENLHVWFKYIPLRRQNRCPEANPAEITEMILRR